MRLSAAAWSFVGASLVEAAQMWRALGIDAMDLIAIQDAPLDAQAIVADPKRQAAQVRAAEIELSNLIYFPGRSFHDPATNARDAAVRARLLEDFARVVEFCNEAGIPSIVVSPGVNQPSLDHAESIKLAAEGLTAMTERGSAAGVTVMFEPHVESVLESPFATLAFLQENPTLRIVLDYSHFIVQGYQQREVDPLAAYAAHVHLRQAAEGQIQARWEDGIIDVAAEVGLLKRHGYDGFLALEYEFDPGWMEMDRVDVVTESIKMRNAVIPLIAG